MSSTCVSCYSGKANLVCRGCDGAVCKTCARFIDEETFRLRDELPTSLSIGAYCNQCYDGKVQPELDVYEGELERARKIPIFTKEQGKESRLYRRSDCRLRVDDCEDREETFLRLAYQAIRAGYDMVLDADVHDKKVRDHAYQKAMWFGTGNAGNTSRKK